MGRVSNLTDKRQLIRAAHAYRLKQSGLTTREIAQQLGIRPEQVKALVEIGERIARSEA